MVLAKAGSEYHGNQNTKLCPPSPILPRYVQSLMNSFKPDHRKSNALFVLGTCFSGLSYLALGSEGIFMKLYWVILCLSAGIICLSLSMLSRYVIHITQGILILSNRYRFLSKRIDLQEVKRVKVVNEEYPVGMYNNTLLHLLLWNRKFSRFKQIHLFDSTGKKIFTIDGQAVENKDFDRLIKVLKRK
jgi:hypothetical protein